jgi:hypothetical protein
MIHAKNYCLYKLPLYYSPLLCEAVVIAMLDSRCPSIRALSRFYRRITSSNGMVPDRLGRGRDIKQRIQLIVSLPCHDRR